jgi:hypothetical protein
MNLFIKEGLSNALYTSVKILEQLVIDGIVSIELYQTIREAMEHDYKLLIEKKPTSEEGINELKDFLKLYKVVENPSELSKVNIINMTLVFNFLAIATWFCLWEMSEAGFTTQITENLASMDDFINKQPSF